MSSNRLMYDSCAYEKAINESTGPFAYTMYTGKYENCAKCRIELGQFGGNGVSLFSGNLVDLESDLRGQTRPASLCPKDKFHPSCDRNGKTRCDGLPCAPGKKYPLVNQPSCQMIRYPPIPKESPFQPMSCEKPRY
jgi:hypothetical protein